MNQLSISQLPASREKGSTVLLIDEDLSHYTCILLKDFRNRDIILDGCWSNQSVPFVTAELARRLTLLIPVWFIFMEQYPNSVRLPSSFTAWVLS